MNNSSDLLLCCDTEDISLLKKLIAEGVNVDIQNKNGDAPLHVAAANGFSDGVSFLLNNGATVDLPNNYGWTSLMQAVRNGHAHVVEVLVKRKAKVNMCNKLGMSAAVIAAWMGNFEVLEILVKAGAMIDHKPFGIHKKDCDFSAVMAAAFRGHQELLTFLLDQGSPAKQKSDVTGLTPLMLSAYNGHLESVQILVEYNAGRNDVNVCGQTALDLACIGGKEEVKLYLKDLTTLKTKIENTKNVDILQAIRKGDVVIVKDIVREDPSKTNIADKLGITPLMLASKLGHLSIVLVLLYAGADVNAVDNESGWTPLIYGVFYRHVEVVQALLEKGARVDIEDQNSYTAFDFAKNIADTLEGKVIQKILLRFSSTSTFCESVPPSDSNVRTLSIPKRSRELASDTSKKSWLSGFSHTLQNKTMSFLSPKSSVNISAVESEVLDDSTNDVFLDSSFSVESNVIGEENDDDDEMNLSIFYSPNFLLAEELKKHTVESIKPPFPKFSKGHPDWLKKMLADHNYPSDPKPQKRMSLRIPNLLRHFNSKRLTDTSEKNIPKRTTISNNCQEVVNEIRSPEKLNPLKENTFSPTCSKISCGVLPGELSILLNEESLQKYAEKFRNQEIDIDAFLCLNEGDLEEIGINSSASQKKILGLIRKLQAK